MDLVTSSRADEYRTISRSEAESLIDWRCSQIKALHVLRSHLIDLKGDNYEDDLCKVTPTSAFLRLTIADAGESDAAYTQCNVWSGDGPETVIDGSFFPDEQRSMLAQILHLAQGVAGKDNAADSQRFSFFVAAKDVDAIKLRIRDRINEFHQLNRNDLESLRIQAFTTV